MSKWEEPTRRVTAWLLDSQTLMPGTKKPSFDAEPDDPDGPPDLLNGDDELQTRALRECVIALGLPPLAPAASQAAALERGGAGPADAHAAAHLAADARPAAD